MSGLSADNLLAAAAVWVAIMLPSAAFGNHPSSGGAAEQCLVLEASPAGQVLDRALGQGV